LPAASAKRPIGPKLGSGLPPPLGLHADEADQRRDFAVAQREY
jgi:hypothetical protein